MKSIRLAMAQINPIVGDLKGNQQKIIHYLRLAKDAGADLVTFPELCICGYPPEDLLLKSSFIQDNIYCIQQIKEAVDSLIVCLGFADRGSDGKVYNAAALIYQREIKGIYHKIHLPNYGVFDEKRYFQPGTDCCRLEIDGIRIGLTICEDLWYNDIIRQLSREGTDLVVNISSSPYHRGKRHLRERLLGGLARENGVFISYTNLVGGQDELVFDGHSLVFNSEGHLLSRGKSFEEELLLTDLMVDDLLSPRRQSRASGPSRHAPADYPSQKISLPFEFREKSDSLLRKKPVHLSPLTEVYQALVLGIQDYVRKNAFCKVVIGLSGGVDSSLVAALATDALGIENVVGVIMPSQFSSSETQEDARRLAQNLGIRHLWLPIHDAFKAYLQTLEEIFQHEKPDITEENLQARIRGNLLMAISNKFGWLVLTTGNKSETSVGYCTIYGDMAGGFAVIKDVPKTLVYPLARHRNKRAGFDLIPQSVLERAPSAELAPNQKDQDSLPPYPLLDAILQRYVERDESLSEIVAAGFDPQIVKRVITLVDRNEYKRRQSPPGIKITPKAFGRDRRMPITNGYWLNNLG